MPDAAPARLPPGHALDEGLAALFRRLQAAPVPERLLGLVDELEEARGALRVEGESRAIG